ncbi:MAG: NAD-dependent epimerase/dehydratase family protein [Draconibacterium sp.]
MKCFVTGATGFIGNRLIEILVDKGHDVNILVRNRNFSNRNPKIKVFQGDLFDAAVLTKAIEGCDVVFHMAAYANLWSKDKTLAFRTNVTGTENVLKAALKNKVSKVVFTSSAGTLAPSETLEKVDETFPVPKEYFTEYETTKRQAEELCIEYVRKGLNVVIVNPSRVYGPGHLNKSNSVTILIKKYVEGKWRIIPGGGGQIGNYVFVDDVVSGHILAFEKGKPGEKYILGGDNVSYTELFRFLAEVTGKKYKMFHLPMSLMMGVGKVEFFLAENFGKKPLITPPWVKRYQQNRLLSIQKAQRELEYSPISLKEGIEKTISWLKETSYGK